MNLIAYKLNEAHVAEVNRKMLANWRALPPLRMSYDQFKALSEYSGSYPTGTTPGKMWRRHNGIHDQDWRRLGGLCLWQIMQYDPDCPPDAEKIKILTYRPVIRVPVGRQDWPDWAKALFE